MKYAMFMIMIYSGSCFASSYEKGKILREAQSDPFIIRQHVLNMMALGVAPEEIKPAKEGRYKRISREQYKTQSVPKNKTFSKQKNSRLQQPDKNKKISQ